MKFIPTESQQANHFKVLIELLVAQFVPLQVYQFAQLEQSETLRSVFSTANEAQCVYYLLVITAGSEAMENRMQHFVDETYTEGKVIVQAYAQEILHKDIQQCNGFLAAVFNKGQLYYSAARAIGLDGFRPPSPKKWLGRAIVHWRNQSHMADGFLKAAAQAIDSDHDQICLFLLNHAIAKACTGLIYVFMGHQPDCSNLERLLYICACFSKLPLQHFLGTPVNEALLQLMMKSCSRTGEPAGFSLKGVSAYRFLELVEGFLKMANTLSEAHFISLQQGVEQWRASRKEGMNND